jgi:hypothetical protein
VKEREAKKLKKEAEKKARAIIKQKEKIAAEAKGETVEEEPEEVESEEEPEEEIVAEPVVEEVEEEEEEEPEEPEEEEEVVDIETIDVFGVEDLFDVGGTPIKQPIFMNFGFEDWSLMTLRFELHLLIHSFSKDVKDKERAFIHEDNIAYYYQRYFRKGLNTAFFGVKTIKELLAFLSDTIMINNRKILETFLPADLETLNVFVLLAEESRRDRQRRADMGEEGAKLTMQSMIGGASLVGQGTGLVQPVRPLVTAGMISPAIKALQASAPRPALVQPANVRPPLQSWAGAAPAWRPGVPQWGAGGARPVGPWGMGQQVGGGGWGPMAGGGMARPAFSGLVRPGLARPAWRG